ncbi:hypothetical protein [Burkholderia anthina]|uniref:hypothetical protein n=1 Tax=Burkholderia anthina TaxID=179879 RepID=UPI00292E278F|nr:hypothetical protein [Burkholderia anthina]WJN76605.1 hypothetical protein OH687_07065 [Burkholderia anthina]
MNILSNFARGRDGWAAAFRLFPSIGANRFRRLRCSEFPTAIAPLRPGPYRVSFPAVCPGT